MCDEQYGNLNAVAGDAYWLSQGAFEVMHNLR